MILRKPYAFLIKHFKIIHFILCLLMIYVVYKINNISKFIADYINNVANTNLATDYVGATIFISILIIIGILVILYILMRYKKKPKLLYLISIIVYTLIFFVLFYVMLNFQIIEKEIIDPKTIRLLRDIVKIIMYPEYIFILIMVIRSLGFDIKKFDFKSDIEEMNIEVTDNEEVELSVGIDTEKIKTRGRRQLRELKYYVLENKIFVFTILGVVGIVTILYLILNINVVNKIYKEGDKIDTSYFSMNLTNSYITTKNDFGEDITTSDSFYVIVKLNVKSLLNDGLDYKLTPSRFLLETGSNTYTPTLKYYDYFKTLGIGYKNQTLSYDNFNTYILVYNVPTEYIDSVKYIRYEEGFEYVKKDYVVKTKKIKISPMNLDKVNLVGTYNLNDKIDLSTSVLSGTFTISSYEINKNFVYEYKYCINDNCENLKNNIVSSTNNQLLKLTVENTSDRYNVYNFANTFIKIKYNIGEKEYTSKLTNKTPISSLNSMYFDVDGNIINANSIWLEITIRNKMYKYMLK